MNQSTTAAAAAAAAAMMEKEKAKEKSIEEQLALPILLAERLRKAAEEADSFKAECSDVGKQADRLGLMLRSVARFTTTAPSLYDRPVRRVLDEVSKNLDRALALVRKCKRRSVLRGVVTMIGIGAADFRKLALLLDASIGDLCWLLTIFDAGGGGGGVELSLPPIASNDPILSWVWSSIASVQMGELPVRIEGANQLASLARDNDRNKKIIVEEGGVAPLLKLLKDNASSAEAQIAGAAALKSLSNDPARVRVIVSEGGIPLIVQVLSNSPPGVQIQAADLVARMAERDLVAQEDFARENAIRPLVSLLSLETFLEEPSPPSSSSSSAAAAAAPPIRPSIHSLVQANKAMGKKNSLTAMPPGAAAPKPRPHSHSSSSSSFNYDGSSRGGHARREWECEKPEVKLQLKITCAEALWMLARGSVLNSKRITETKGLLCLAKIIEKERQVLQINCLMTVMEITAAAESNTDLRRSAFRTNSPAAKAVVEQLLRVINESDNPALQIPAIKSMGSLARTFPARETRVIEPLVTLLSHFNLGVATEAAISLAKFANPDNFLRMEHSKAIVDFNCIPPLLRLLRGNERAQLQGLYLLCYLALHAGNNEALEQARVKTALEGADRSVAAQHPELRELISKALYHLNLYHSSVLPPSLSSYTD